MNEHDLIQSVRSKVDIVDVISSYIPLVQKGKNYFGVCPFHDDTNPSMSVSRSLQIYKCFSCGASGNVFNFVMDYEHITFKEALELLAKKAGVEVKGLKLKKENTQNEPYYKMYELALKFYQNNLNTSFARCQGVSEKTKDRRRCHQRIRYRFISYQYGFFSETFDR